LPLGFLPEVSASKKNLRDTDKKEVLMITDKLRCGVIATLLGCAVSIAAGQEMTLELPQEMIVTYSSAQSITVPINDGISTLVGVQPDQLIQVVVKYSPSQALQVVNLEGLDGGTVLPPIVGPIDPGLLCSGDGCPQGVPALSLFISTEGMLTFTFRAGHTTGLNQVSLVDGSQEVGLQFWVLNLQTPDLNPPAATADNPSY
jgi:hypothetical protein